MRGIAVRNVPYWRRFVAGSVSGTLVALTIGHVPAAAAVATVYERMQAQQDASVPGTATAATSGPDAKGTGKPFAAPAPLWPAPGTAELTLPDVVAQSAGTSSVPMTRVGGLPVRLERIAPAQRTTGPDGPDAAVPALTKVEVLSRQETVAAGVDGVVLRLGPTSGRVRVGLDYSGFRYAYGGDWAHRLRLVSLADRTELPVRNDVRSGTLTAEVDASAGTTLALTAGSAGSTGDLGATSLSPSSTWQAGDNSGGFTWSYPMGAPPSLNGPAPKVELAYASAGVDGRMAASNNQPSWMGEGFELAPGGFIERRYKSCGKDGGNGASAGTGSGDLCWKTDNAVLSLNGESTELIKGADGKWHGRTEDGSRVERFTGADNDDNDGEYWVVTTPDGTQYWFGQDRLKGWTSDAAETNSVWTVPVYGNQSGEPCHSTQWCQQAYRWNLDYVVDRNGNTMSYWYQKETNKYARNLSGASLTSYVRGGYLTRIDYGTRSSTAYGTAPMQVLFNAADRCLSNCTTKSATDWPDTPWDRECSTASCLVGSPTFWTTKRLASVRTRVWTGSSTTYRNVESWTFTHSFPDPGDTTRAGLWLERIAHAGLVGGTTDVPDVTFTGVQMPNRVDAVDASPAMNWWRVAYIDTESGARIGVSYSSQDCVKGSRMPSAPESNTLRCYPVRWKPQGYTSAITDYFHRYVVTQVTETDLALPSDARSPRMITAYQYLGAPAWHYTDVDGLTDEEDRTWSQWRGYARVRVIQGDPGEQTQTESLYFRGMHGDKLPSGSRSVSVQAAEGPAVTDEDAYAGMVREKLTYDGPDGPVVSAIIYDPWQSAATASRTVGGVTVHARYVDTAAELSRVALDGGRGWRRTTTKNTFDAYGMKTNVEQLGDLDRPDDQQCTLTTYVRNTTDWLLSYPSRVRQLGVDCTAAAGTVAATDVISDVYTSYDQQARGVAPTKGLVSRTESLSGWPSTYLTTARATHDSNGRVTQQWDVRGNLSTTAYTQPGGGPVTGTTTTNHLGWVTTTTLDPAWGARTAVVDANNRRSDVTYDGLGRVTGVWEPGRSKASGQAANVQTTYTLRNNGATVISTAKLNAAGGYTTSHTLLDAHLRPRQTQAPDVPVAGAAQGRVLTDTFYDSAGRKVKTNDRYVADGAPSSTLNLPLPDAQVPAQTQSVYDGSGRVTASIFLVNGVEKWRNTSSYGGDRTDVTPPAGAPPTSALTDAYGRITAQRQYHGTTPTGTYDETRYEYNSRGDLAAVIDPVGNRWSYGYDLLGRKTTSDDPDKGLTVDVYNDFGDLVSSTDSRGETLAWTYDGLGRKTSLRDDTVSGTKRAEWSYDTITDGITSVDVKGQLVRSTRWIGTDAYIDEVTGFNGAYQPTGRKITIPSSATGVAGSYSYVYGYRADGSPANIRLPGLGGLATETLTVGYGSTGLASTLSTNLSSTGDDVFYVNGTGYTRYGELSVIGRRYDTGKIVDSGSFFEVGTRRLSRLLTTRETGPSLVTDVNYDWDPAGNVIRVADAADGDTQCFSYDRLRRLTEAWTPTTGDCQATRSQAGLGGPAPYWQSFTYDVVGNRQTMTDRTRTSSISTSYTYPAAGTDQPHALDYTQSGGVTSDYSYDTAGNTRTRPSAAGTQTLTWNAEGSLESSVDTTGTTSYIYDANGKRLLRVDPTGRTLYLPDQELRYTGSTTSAAGTRYYRHGGQTIGMRNSSGVTWLVNDRHGTAQASIVASTQAVTVRRQKPFGEARGSVASWPNDKGFVGGTNDNTGLVHLGSREYDSAIGRFISVDPVIDHNDPQQLHGYAYSNNNPMTFSDPDGRLCILCMILAIIALAFAVIHHITSGGGSSGGGSSGGGSSGGGRGGPSPMPKPKPKPTPAPSPTPAPTPSPSPGPTPTPCTSGCSSSGGVTVAEALVNLALALAAYQLKSMNKLHDKLLQKGVSAGANTAQTVYAGGKAAYFVWSATAGAPVSSAYHTVVGGVATVIPAPLRRLQAKVVGAAAAKYAESNGGKCTVEDGLRICRGGGGVLSQRGGTTYGGTFLTDEKYVSDDTIKHEKEHGAQWNRYGALYGPMYLWEQFFTAGDPCRNRYEVAADKQGDSYGC